MAFENGIWIMRGRAWDDPERADTWQALVDRIDELGFLPFFANELPGFSAEEQVSPRYWWTDDPERDPWLWRERIASGGRMAYGKFFDKKAGFISLRWLPHFVNFRRNGYDFDARWSEGLANRREKAVMDFYLGEDEAGELIYREPRIMSTDLKQLAGFGPGGEKNFPGIVTGLQMQLYLVIAEFRRRESRRGKRYGMPVSILLPPEALWGREAVCGAYSIPPAESRRRIAAHMQTLYPGATEQIITKLIGKEPE